MLTRLWGLARQYRDMNWSLVDQAMVSGSNFLTGVLIARALGLEGFGVYTLIWLIAVFIQNLQHALINTPLLTYGARAEADERSVLLGAVMTRQLVFSGASTLITFVTMVAAMAAQQIPGIAMAAALSACVASCQWQDFFRRLYFTVEKPFVGTMIDAVRYLGQPIVLIGFLVFSDGNISVTTALWITALAASLSCLAALVDLPRIDAPGRAFDTINDQHWEFGKWMAGTAVLQWIALNIFTLLSGALLGPAYAGALKAAQSLLGILHIPFFALDNFLPARGIKMLRDKGRDGLHDMLNTYLVVGTAAVSAVAAIFFIAPEFWLGLVFGEEFTQNADVLRWYGLIYVFYYINLIYRFGLRILEQTRAIFLGYVVAVGVLAIAAYPLLLHVGLAGAIIGLAAVPLIHLAVLFPGYRRALKRPKAAS